MDALLLVVLLLGTLVPVSATEYQDCGSADQVHVFDVSNCDVPPCVVERPSNYSVDIVFTSASDAEQLSTVIGAYIAGIDYPWPGPDGCQLLQGGSCPLTSGTTYSYSAFMPVKPEYPAVSAVVTWKLQDEFGIDHVCARFPIVLV